MKFEDSAPGKLKDTGSAAIPWISPLMKAEVFGF